MDVLDEKSEIGNSIQALTEFLNKKQCQNLTIASKDGMMCMSFSDSLKDPEKLSVLLASAAIQHNFFCEAILAALGYVMTNSPMSFEKFEKMRLNILKGARKK